MEATAIKHVFSDHATSGALAFSSTKVSSESSAHNRFGNLAMMVDTLLDFQFIHLDLTSKYSLSC